MKPPVGAPRFIRLTLDRNVSRTHMLRLDVPRIPAFDLHRFSVLPVITCFPGMASMNFRALAVISSASEAVEGVAGSNAPMSSATHI
jgi:hypothetical protein